MAGPGPGAPPWVPAGSPRVEAWHTPTGAFTIQATRKGARALERTVTFELCG